MNRENTFVRLLNGLTAVLLVLAICLPELYKGVHHSFSHNHDTHAACTEETEKDPCHLRTYHGQNQGSCEHPIHLHVPISYCDLCDAVLTKYEFPEEEISISVQKVICTNNTLYKEDLFIADTNTFTSSRAPPLA